MQKNERIDEGKKQRRWGGGRGVRFQSHEKKKSQICASAKIDNCKAARLSRQEMSFSHDMNDEYGGLHGEPDSVHNAYHSPLVQCVLQALTSS